MRRGPRWNSGAGGWYDIGMTRDNYGTRAGKSARSNTHYSHVLSLPRIRIPEDEFLEFLLLPLRARVYIFNCQSMYR